MTPSSVSLQSHHQSDTMMTSSATLISSLDKGKNYSLFIET